MLQANPSFAVRRVAVPRRRGVVRARRWDVHLQAGSQPLAGYRLTRPLGGGPLGPVWEARRAEGESVALRFLAGPSRPLPAISREIRLLRSLIDLRHPAILPLLGLHATSGGLVLISERAHANLADLHSAYRRQTGGNVPPDHALALLDQAARALDFLAASRLIGLAGDRPLAHGAIKPSNLLLIGNRLKVADVGLAAGFAAVPRNAGGPFAAPEQAAGEVSPRSDQYALAITFCTLVMGDRPFRKAGGGALDLNKLRETELPVLARAVDPDPERRWPTCTGFVAALRTAVHAPRPAASVRIFPRGRLGPLGMAPPVPFDE